MEGEAVSGFVERICSICLDKRSWVARALRKPAVIMIDRQLTSTKLVRTKTPVPF